MKILQQTAGSLLRLNQDPAILAIIGCGGKTTFIDRLAHEFSDQKVLISPTTKIRPMREPDIVQCETLLACIAHQAKTGIQCLGIYNHLTDKLEALPPILLRNIVTQYDIVLLEADGSRGLPCKGWREHEPVIPDYCTHTVGIVSVKSIDHPADMHTVFNLDRFTDLTGARKGDIITVDTISAMMRSPNGMFKHSVGNRYVFINQAERRKEKISANMLIDRLRNQRLSFAGLAYGCAKHNRWKGV